MSTALTFAQLEVPPGLHQALQRMGFLRMTPIQAATIAPALKGRDVLGSSQTGTGKTAAFAVPGLAWLYRNPGAQMLVLAPTRELATQTFRVLRQLGREMKLKGSLVLGGESFSRQSREAGGDADFLVATPGRLNDHLAQQTLKLDRVGFFVLDEVDLMLDMGFAPQIRSIASCLTARPQTLFFSATLPPPILDMARTLLRDPVRTTVGVTTEPVAALARVNRKVNKDDKAELLLQEVSQREGRILVFARTQIAVEAIAKTLARAGQSVDFLHGERTQSQRRHALQGFRDGTTRILVATDLAARGLDIPEIASVINYHLPQTRDEYLHRVGRTGRAGKTGTAVNFVTPADKPALRRLGKVLGIEEPGRPTKPAPAQRREPLRFSDRGPRRPGGRKPKPRSAGRRPGRNR
jgi:superfamily II DNA/RNA helicase